VGATITSQQVRSLRAQIAQLEQSRAQLQTNADALAAALREARAPLARHIHELESTLAARELAPRPEETVGASAAVATPPPAPPEERVARRDSPSPPRRERPAPPPAVSAPPPPDKRPCRPIPEPEFALASPDQETTRLTGDLVDVIEAVGPDLVMGLGDGTRHPLVDVPLHVATQCGDLSYIVSICVAEPDPFEVRGVISPADAWDKPCRALLRARGPAEP
jgi:hypothetical protein